MATAPRMTVETSDDVRVQFAELTARVLSTMCTHKVGNKVREVELAKILGTQGMVKRSILEALETLEHRGWCTREMEMVEGGKKFELWLVWKGRE